MKIDLLETARKRPYNINIQMIACGLGFGDYSKFELNFIKHCVRRKFGLGHHAFKKQLKFELKVLQSPTLINDITLK